MYLDSPGRTQRNLETNRIMSPIEILNPKENTNRIMSPIEIMNKEQKKGTSSTFNNKYSGRFTRTV